MSRMGDIATQREAAQRARSASDARIFEGYTQADFSSYAVVKGRVSTHWYCEPCGLRNRAGRRCCGCRRSQE